MAHKILFYSSKEYVTFTLVIILLLANYNVKFN